MLHRINKLYLNLHLFVVLSVIIIIILTEFNPGSENLLRNLTKEGSVFEWLSFLTAFVISGFSLLVYFHSREAKVFRKTRRKFIFYIAVAGYLAAMEEISWGQHIFGFKNIPFFEANNLQNETNFHNLISGEWFNLAIHSVVYVFFIFLPLIVYFSPNMVNHSPSIRGKITIYLPSIHNILMFCFSCSLQAYFMPRTLVDTSLVLIAMVAILILLIKNDKYRSRMHFLHFALVASAIVTLMVCHESLAYANMQYEIREFVIMYAFLYWLYNWTSNLKNKIALQLK